MSIVIRDRDFRVVRSSLNLRAIIEHNKHHVVERVDLFSCGTLGVTWENGDSTVCDFASVEVTRRWVKARRAFNGKIHEVRK